jgi:hypothetical protein
MAHTVLVASSVARAAANLDKRHRRAYGAAIAGLKGEGCKAGGYRLAAIGGGDYPMCCRHLIDSWRLHTVFPDDERIVVISLAEHDSRENPHQILFSWLFVDAPGRIRTCDPRIRNPTLYPAELRRRVFLSP